MRKLSLLSLTGLAALSLVAAPAQSGTIAAGDVPDMALQEGTPLEGVDLSSFFASPSSELTYEVTGGSVDGSVATIFAEAGTASFTATDADGDSASDDSNVSVLSSLASGIMVDDNNRIVGTNGGNLFINGIVPGNTVDSVANLVLPGGGGTPGGGTPGAAAMATVGTFSVVYDGADGANTGLRMLMKDAADPAGLTVTLNDDGSYSLATTADFSEAAVVSFGSSMDAVHLVAAPAVAANVNDAASFSQIPTGNGAPQADVAFGDDGITITADAGEGILLAHNGAVEIPGYATISMDYTADANVTLAVFGFAGDLGAAPLFLQNNVEIEAGVNKNAATDVLGDSVTPGLQVFNGGDSTVTVTVSALHIVSAKPVVDYALNPNYEVDLVAPSDGTTPVDGSIAEGLTGWGADVNGQGGGAPELADANHFDTPTSAGSVMLTPAGDSNLSNVFAQATLGAGAYVAQAFVQAAGDAGTFDLVAINLGGGSTAQGQAFAPAGEWTKVLASGTTSVGGPTFLVLQASGGAFMADDVQILQVDPNEGSYYCDPAMLD
jgi:hypothetical protein